MMKTKQVQKSKDLSPLPSFSIGLTQLEEEKRNVIGSSSRGDKNQPRKTREAKGKEKKQHVKKEEKKHNMNNMVSVFELNMSVV
ncbi:unnamed protein product [Trifolium pratense]|uniref:Uncharacterized protein n=1 Tax=Trifolium pratense TaxID=57577 RepID=A0ACB0MBH3_TRIPR|nr:unnamed protein product [Trifolium pratense]